MVIQMINKSLLTLVAACTLSVQSFAQEPAKQQPVNAAPAPDALPPEPDKSLKREIWEGYYNALLNRNYHLERSVQMDKASAGHATSGRKIAVASFIVPFIILTLLLQHAVKQRAEGQKLKWVLGPMACTITVLLIAGFGIWYGIESSVGGSAEQTRAQEHKELYQDWKALAHQWQDLHDLSLKRQPKEILSPQYDRLHELEEAIIARETPDLYDAELHRNVQAKLDEYLIEDAKQAKS